MSEFGGFKDLPFLAELYDLVPMYANLPDRTFYLDACREANGKILELGCGTGRILIPAAEAGCRITGLDISEHMLSKCREKLGCKDREVQNRVRLVNANMIDFRLDESFDLFIIPFRAFQHILSPADQLACLRNINNHLNDSGRLIFDIFHVDFSQVKATEDGREFEDTPQFEIGDGRQLRRTHRVNMVHKAEQVMDVEMIFYLTDSDGTTQRLVQGFPFRYLMRYEVEHLLARCGFEIVDLFGDFTKSPLADDSPDMIFIAERSS